MKKKLSLDKLNINSFVTKEKVTGGNEDAPWYSQSTCPTFTYNEWCYGSDNSIGRWCTAPK